MKSLTYGTIPEPEEFRRAFDAVCHNGEYGIFLSQSNSDACTGFILGRKTKLTKWELYGALAEIVTNQNWGDKFDDEGAAYPGSGIRMALVSSILETLGFEWI